MSAENPGIAFFNLERTTTDFVYKRALYDIAQLHSTDELNGYVPAKQDQAELAGWLACHEEAELLPLMRRTADMTYHRLSPWARIALGVCAGLKMPLCLYSASVPQEIVDAYATGIQSSIYGLEVCKAQGRNIHDMNVGEEGVISRNSVIGALGQGLGFIADSFPRATPHMIKTPHLLVNPDQNARYTWNVQDFNRLDYPHTKPSVITWRPAGHTSVQTFDLNKGSSRDEFRANLRKVIAA